MITLHVQVVPPHDHDALLNRILHFWNINMKLRMPRCRWSTSPAAARSAISTRCTPGTIITTTISQKTRENLAHARCSIHIRLPFNAMNVSKRYSSDMV